MEASSRETIVPKAKCLAAAWVQSLQLPWLGSICLDAANDCGSALAAEFWDLAGPAAALPKPATVCELPAESCADLLPAFQGDQKDLQPVLSEQVLEVVSWDPPGEGCPALLLLTLLAASLSARPAYDRQP